MKNLIGHFHPVLVHLPIGILLLAAIFYLVSGIPKYRLLKEALGPTLLLGMLAAIASCISGYTLSTLDDYDADAVQTHQWMGIGVATLAILCWWLHQRQHKTARWVAVAMTALIFTTGHTGGTLTHGEGYLSWGAASDKTELKRAPIANVQEAVVYTDVVKPLLESHCYNCHGGSKQKGKLRLDNPQWILKGGKSGETVVAGQPGESEMIRRLLLPASSKEHMPPKEKPQLHKSDIALIHWWISQGASFDKKVKDLPQTNDIKPVLALLQKGETEDVVVEKTAIIPAEPVAEADAKAIEALRDRGAVVLPVALNSHYLSVNFITVPDFTEKDLQLLQPVKAQVTWLKLSNQPVTDAGLRMLATLPALTRLSLERTAITDAGMAAMAQAKQLNYLNLLGTRITAAGLKPLQGLKNLKEVYTYESGIQPTDLAALKKLLPGTRFDSGGYQVPTLASDTIVLSKPMDKE